MGRCSCFALLAPESGAGSSQGCAGCRDFTTLLASAGSAPRPAKPGAAANASQLLPALGSQAGASGAPSRAEHSSAWSRTGRAARQLPAATAQRPALPGADSSASGCASGAGAAHSQGLEKMQPANHRPPRGAGWEQRRARHRDATTVHPATAVGPISRLLQPQGRATAPLQQHQERPWLPAPDAAKSLIPGATCGVGTAVSPSEAGRRDTATAPSHVRLSPESSTQCPTSALTSPHPVYGKGKEKQLLGKEPDEIPHSSVTADPHLPWLWQPAVGPPRLQTRGLDVTRATDSPQSVSVAIRGWALTAANGAQPGNRRTGTCLSVPRKPARSTLW